MATMTTLHSEPTEAEKKVIREIRDAVERKVAQEGWTREQLAEKFGLLPWGVQVLFAKSWTLDRACRIAHILGIPVEVRVVE
ncbi:MAG: hypothetical protein AB1758_19370 [Candidatus Eremiobacterota bacterium]